MLRRKDWQISHTICPEASTAEREKIECLHIDCDSIQTWQYMHDKVYDVLTRYRELNGIFLEHPSDAHQTCSCVGTTRQLKQDLGKTLDELSAEEYLQWKAIRIRDILMDLKALVKSIIRWARDDAKINPQFKGMTFFNEAKIPDENRHAVYDSIAWHICIT